MEEVFEVSHLVFLCAPQRLVVCLEESVYIHNIKDMKLLKTLLNTPSNLSGNSRGIRGQKCTQTSERRILRDTG